MFPNAVGVVETGEGPFAIVGFSGTGNVPLTAGTKVLAPAARHATSMSYESHARPDAAANNISDGKRGRIGVVVQGDERGLERRALSVADRIFAG